MQPLQLPTGTAERQLAMLYHGCSWLASELEEDEFAEKCLRTMREGMAAQEAQYYDENGKLLHTVYGDEGKTGVRLASYQPGRIEFEPHENAPQDLAQRLGQKFQLWTGNRWAVTLVNEGGKETIAEKRDAADIALKAEAAEHPLLKAVFDAFPGAKIIDIKTPEEIAQEAMVDALPEVEDEWDPFEED